MTVDEGDRKISERVGEPDERCGFLSGVQFFFQGFNRRRVSQGS